MNINERQFKQLQTMGVSLWQSRSGVFVNVEDESVKADNSKTKSTPTDSSDNACKDNATDVPLTAQTSADPNDKLTERLTDTAAEKETETLVTTEEVKITFSDNLLKQSIVNDVAIALNVNIAQISLNAFGLDLDGLSWQIGQSEHCELEQNLLTTPAIEDFSNNAELKRALWLCLSQYLNSKPAETQ
ncbi:DNA polymerase III subunit psi [Thalassotalea crassostreae]|uniref:DNA polymerase III subunit psi n=1 Tax=Thalassotalea crassostreae TaxID=1763536 RepID=UPI000837F8E3|nr:DNA polymerase III subunit psi [Thalassotalea crassostreae]